MCRVASLLEERQEEAVVLEHRISRRKQEAIIKFQVLCWWCSVGGVVGGVVVVV